MSRNNQFGRAYYNWMNNIRNNYERAYRVRVRNEAEAANATAVEIIKAERVHWYVKENAKNHHTIKFDQIHDQDNQQPVLRRGQTFYVAIRFNRNVDIKKDRIILNLKFGPKPAVNKDTMAVVVVENDKFIRSTDEWDARIDPGTRGKDLVLQVYIPVSAKVGIWKMDVRSGLQDKSITTDTLVYEDTRDIFILFNPWCKDDLVYMEDDEKREEYVVNDKGKVYIGTHSSPRGRPWAFGQFDDVVLPVAVYVMELSRIPYTERGNPVKVVRAISAGVNSSNDFGILEGRWDGEYSDGVAPFKWTGSVRILEEYVKSGYQPVKYGQCWVFSAVTTTICRALGIPCRSVTNFVSAHDTNSSLTIDKFFDKEGSEIEGGPDGESWDSIWNFHVWNEVWMARTDLPPGYGGWQVIDATPQEESDSKMQCGPASLEAVRRGDIGLGFDGAFVFAEVNADVMHWGKDESSDWGFSRLKMNKFHIGRLILTKKSGVEDDDLDEDKEDLIEQYKSPEGSAAERLAIHNAIRGCRRAQQYYEYKGDKKEDVTFDLIEIDEIGIGDPFKVKVLVKNTSEEKRTITAALSARSVYYTGVHHSIIKKAEGKFQLEPGKEQDVALTVDYKEYWKKLQDYCNIKMYVIFRVVETGQTWSEEDDFIVKKPKLNITVPSEVKVREKCQVTFSFKNPLDEPLTQCHLSIDGAGLIRPQAFDIDKPVPADGEFEYNYEFLPRIHGERKLIAAFNSKELFDVNGVSKITVTK